MPVPPTETTLGRMQWADVMELYDAQAGDGSMLAVTRVFPADGQHDEKVYQDLPDQRPASGRCASHYHL